METCGDANGKMTIMDQQPESPARAGDDALGAPTSISPTAMSLLAASMARGLSSIIRAVLDPAARTLIDALRQLGVVILTDQAAGRVQITGHGGHWVHGDLELDCGQQPSAAHLLLAACVLGRSRYRLTNPPAMTASLTTLVNALTDLGAQIHADRSASGPVIQIGSALFRGGQTSVRDGGSSSTVASLLLAAPCAVGDVFLEIPPWPARPPEVSIALQILEDCGITVIDDQATRLIVPAPQSYAACEHDISIRTAIR